MITIQNMKYMTEIAKQKSFSAAAKALFLSQSTLSSAVKEVEGQIGITLFRRTNRGIEITFEGQKFLRHAQEIVNQAEYIEQLYQHHRYVPYRFSVSTQRIPVAVMSFTQIVNELSIEQYDIAIRECATYEVIRDVTSNLSTLGILCINETYRQNMERLFFSNNLVFREISALRPFVFIHKGHPLAEYKSLTFEQLQEYSFVTYDQGDNYQPQFSEELMFKESLRKNIHVIDRCTKIALVRQTNCFSIGTSLTNSDADQMHSNLNEVRAIKLADETQTIHLGYISKKDYDLDEIAKKYLKILTDSVNALVKYY